MKITKLSYLLASKPIITAPKKKDFFSFTSEISEGKINYEGDYSYLKFPIELFLQGKDVNIQKGSQIGATEAGLYYMAFSLFQQKNIYFMLPTFQDAKDFSASRLNPVLKNMPNFEFDNVFHKRYGRANLYLRGASNTSKSRSKIKSVPVNIVITDEIDEIEEAILLELAERLSGSKEKQIIRFSTPTTADRGIAKRVKEVKLQYRFVVSCLFCGFAQEIDEDNINLDSELYHCKKCKKSWSHKEKMKMQKKGFWQTFFIGDIKKEKEVSFFIPQFYSPTVTSTELIRSVKNADNDYKKQILYNHKFGLPYSAEGARISRELILDRLGDIATKNLPKVLGVDVGFNNHYAIACSVHPCGLIVTDILRLSWDDLENFLKDRKISCFVIDANPERSQAKRLVEKYFGYMALYPNMKETTKFDEDKKFVSIHRTEAIDTVLNFFRSDNILIQQNLNQFEIFCRHLTSIIRQYREVRGCVEAYYTETGEDHYLHALVYAYIASLKINIEEEKILGKFI